MAGLPNSGQKKIPLAEWKRFVRVADWWDRTFGHKPPSVNRPEYGRDLIVKTPSGGIAARSSTTIYSELCEVCIEVETATLGQRTITETDNTVRVYNLSGTAVEGSAYIPTSLTTLGERYAIPPPSTAPAFKTWKYGQAGIRVTNNNIVALQFYPASPSIYYTHPTNFTLPGFTDDGVEYITVGTSGWYYVATNLYILSTTGALNGPTTVSTYFALQNLSNPASEISPDGEIGIMQTFSDLTYGGYVTTSRSNVAYLTAGNRLKCRVTVGPVTTGGYTELITVYVELTIGPLVTTDP